MAESKLPFPDRRRAMMIAVFGGVLVLLAAGATLSAAVTVKVYGDQVAVRQVYVGPKQGLQREIIGPGLQLVIPGYERLHVFPRDLQVLDMNDGETKGGSATLDEDYVHAPAIRVQTADGFPVTIDITVMYRIVDPYTLITKVGPGRLYETKIVRQRADTILRQTLGTLKAEGFYRDAERTAAEDQARRALAADLEPWGLQLWTVAIRDYTYDERFQGQIEARKNEDQRKFKNQAETAREVRLAEKNTRVAEMQQQIEQVRGEGDLAVRMIRADGEKYYRAEAALGEKALAIAAADASRLERTALEAAGASNLVGLEMAETLKGTKVIIVSTTGPGAVNPFDLDKMVGAW